MNDTQKHGQVCCEAHGGSGVYPKNPNILPPRRAFYNLLEIRPIMGENEKNRQKETKYE
jgi:hypothetical protein